MFQFWMKFIFKFVPPKRFATSSNTRWISSLNHELFDHSMKYAMIIIVIFSQTTKVLDSFGAFSRKQFNLNITQICVNSRGFKKFGSCYLFSDGNTIFVSWFFVKNVSIRMIAISSR